MTKPDLWLQQLADGDTGRLLDCGHVGEFAGVCQYDRCANRLCAHCIASCETCGKVLGRPHQVVLDEGKRVFCLNDAKRYLIKKGALHILGGNRDA